MSERFTQKRILLEHEKGTGKLKVSKLLEAVEHHQYFNRIVEQFNTNDIKDEIVSIDHVDVVFNRVKYLNDNFYRVPIFANSKDISISRSNKSVDGINDDKPLVFHFKKYINVDGEECEDLVCYPIYNAKNTFLDDYEMTKYANRLYRSGLDQLAEYNINFFKNLAEQNPQFDKRKSYRLVQNKNDVFLRGITSSKYHEYGVDFAFTVAILILHQDMKQNPGNNYEISSVAISESKLELIVVEKNLKEVKEFGKVGSAITISTNDLGQGSLNFTKIINVKGRHRRGIYLFPESEEAKRNKLAISHSTGVDKVFENLQTVFSLLNNTDEYIDDLKDIKSIRTPDELRSRIFNKLVHPRSAFKDIHSVQDIFKSQIDNEISSFAKLLDMCNKAEELDIDYDLKDKLRYIISDIILSRKKAD